jgi:hypothetical protein
MKIKTIEITDNAGITYNPVLSNGYQDAPAINFVSTCGTKGSTPKWGLSLLQFKGDKLAIDHGQNWIFEDVQPTLKEIRRVLSGC